MAGLLGTRLVRLGRQGLVGRLTHLLVVTNGALSPALRQGPWRLLLRPLESTMSGFARSVLTSRWRGVWIAFVALGQALWLTAGSLNWPPRAVDSVDNDVSSASEYPRFVAHPSERVITRFCFRSLLLDIKLFTVVILLALQEDALDLQRIS